MEDESGTVHQTRTLDLPKISWQLLNRTASNSHLYTMVHLPNMQGCSVASCSFIYLSIISPMNSLFLRRGEVPCHLEETEPEQLKDTEPSTFS